MEYKNLPQYPASEVLQMVNPGNSVKARSFSNHFSLHSNVQQPVYNNLTQWPSQNTNNQLIMLKENQYVPNTQASGNYIHQINYEQKSKSPIILRQTNYPLSQINNQTSQTQQLPAFGGSHNYQPRSTTPNIRFIPNEQHLVQAPQEKYPLQQGSQSISQMKESICREIVILCGSCGKGSTPIIQQVCTYCKSAYHESCLLHEFQKQTAKGWFICTANRCCRKPFNISKLLLKVKGNILFEQQLLTWSTNRLVRSKEFNRCPKEDCGYPYIYDPNLPKLHACPKCSHRFCLSCVAEGKKNCLHNKK